MEYIREREAKSWSYSRGKKVGCADTAGAIWALGAHRFAGHLGATLPFCTLAVL